MRYLLAAVSTAALLASPAAHAQIIVNDPTSIGNDIATWAQQAKDMATQIENMKNQLTAAKTQLDELEHGKLDLGSLLPNETSTLQNNLPQQWQGTYNDAMGGSDIQSQAQAIVDRFNNQTQGMDPQEKLDFVEKQVAQKSAYDRVMLQKSYDNQMDEMKTMQQLTQQISQTTTPKDIADLQARIQTAQGAVQGEQAKVALMKGLQNAEGDLLQKQRDAAVADAYIGHDVTSPTLTDR